MESTKTSSAFRQNLTTKEAADALGRQPRTLNRWAFQNRGPIKPIKIYGRLAWPADEVAALLAGGQK